MTAYPMRRTKFRAAIVAALAGATLATGCASGLGGDTYTRGQTGVPQETVSGTLTAMRQVRIEGTRSGIGAGTGAIVGGLVGAATEEGVTGQTGWEYTVNLDNGSTVTIVQGDREPVSTPGGRVRVLYGPGVVRVAPAY